MAKRSIREELNACIKEKYETDPEYLWINNPDYSVFRHSDNGKWFGFVLKIPRNKLGMDGNEDVEILSLKLSDPLLADFLVQQNGYFRGYPSDRGNWISILLDGSVPLEDVCKWLDESFTVTCPKKKAFKKGAMHKKKTA